jgi:hypothetical protein
MKTLFFLLSLANLWTTSVHALTLGLDGALAPGLDGALTRAAPVCIADDLRPECASQTFDVNQPTNEQYYVEWDNWAKRCVIEMYRLPPEHIIVGGGPYVSRDAARAAISTVPGCK